MISLKLTPVPKAPVVSGEGLYAAMVSTDRSHYEDLGLKVRARTSVDAERKIVFCFMRELKGKTLDFALDEVEKRINRNTKTET